jgi:hypothetical protein
LLALIGGFNGANTVARQQESPQELLLELSLLELPLLELLLPRGMSGDLPTDPDPQSPGARALWRSRLWLRPRALPGRCDREPPHGKMVQNRVKWLSILLDAIVATENYSLRGTVSGQASDNVAALSSEKL